MKKNGKQADSSSFAHNPFRAQLQGVSVSRKVGEVRERRDSKLIRSKPSDREEILSIPQEEDPCADVPVDMLDAGSMDRVMDQAEEDVFLQAMADVDRWTEDYPVPVPLLSEAPSFTSPEDLVRDTLEKLVSGEIEFDMSQHEEFVEGCIHGLDPRVLQKLRRGEFSWQAHLDLHGFRVEEARTILEHFVLQQRRKNHRCFLVVHGRGLHSPDKEPILKQQLIRWFTRGFLRKQVLAFVTARPQDGGPGAMYVLLRRI